MNRRPIHSTRRNLASIAANVSRFVLGALAMLVVLACYIAVCWLAYAATCNPMPQ